MDSNGIKTVHWGASFLCQIHINGNWEVWKLEIFVYVNISGLSHPFSSSHHASDTGTKGLPGDLETPCHY